MNLHEKNHRSSSATANAVGGKTARACDSCLRRRARWYCAADDAFLCQACDSSVHSANPLARRHDRVRLKTASSSLASPKDDLVDSCGAPTWHHGFKRKARTPRNNHAKSMSFLKPAPRVPDLELAEAEEEEQEQLIYRVPIFDPVLSEFCSPPAADDVVINPLVEDTKPASVSRLVVSADNCHGHGFVGFNPSDMELAEFAADVESLLGQGLEEDSFCMDDALGLMDARDEDMSQVKVEVDVINAVDGGGFDRSNFNMEMELSRESLDINFDCESPAAGEEVEEQKLGVAAEGNGAKIGLRLDYEAVIAAWSCRGCSPWTDGERPQFNPNDCWPDFMGISGGGADVQGSYGDIWYGGHAAVADGGREARVSRYREKRRTRLFSKKIRYEVRKLNAEKRPRMKGRFVKRSSFPVVAGAPAGYTYA
ncbi:zinc finger protein CONSTANS-LIKE 16-like [Iris pallida]|uniref:Zinc finger protein CONSTANS-LIKE 16-like n=1 Tax=Iris pallida TaxID=29817 RepID=A0AAX6I0K0_IRIPA|nr:zinc finger protein CONSTANS-LIKE 16-like [Iris pallida]